MSQLKSSLKQSAAANGVTVVEVPLRHTSETRTLVKIGFKDEGPISKKPPTFEPSGPVIGFFSDGTFGQMGEPETVAGITMLPWYTRREAWEFAKLLGVPLEEL